MKLCRHCKAPLQGRQARYCSKSCIVLHRHWRKAPRRPRYCQHCAAVLIQREGEINSVFKRRKHCGHSCASKSGSRRGFVIERALLLLLVVALLILIGVLSV